MLSQIVIVAFILKTHSGANQQNNLSLIQIGIQFGVVIFKLEEAVVRDSTIAATPLKHLDVLGPQVHHDI